MDSGLEEQRIWRQLEELKKEPETEQNKKRIASLEKKLSKLQGRDCQAIEAENIALKKRYTIMEKELSELRKRHGEMRKVFGSLDTGIKREEKPGKEKQHKLYELLLKKFAPHISETEKKTVEEIKGLVNKEDMTIQSIIEDIKPDKYEFEKHYEDAAKKAFKYLTEEIEYVKPEIGVNFWLEPKDMLEAGIADDEDFAVLLCATLGALGDEKAEVVIAELDDLTTHAFVLTQIKGKYAILDPTQKNSYHNFQGEKNHVLEKYAFNGAKIKRFLYKFNRQEYEQFI